MPSLERRVINFCAFALLSSLPALVVAVSEDDPVNYLMLESVPDGHCQNLSDGGKLRVVRNSHRESAIDFRLIRTFVGKAQGLSTGSALPASEPFKLGCTKVDGRAQDWVIERASFKRKDN